MVADKTSLEITQAGCIKVDTIVQPQLANQLCFLQNQLGELPAPKSVLDRLKTYQDFSKRTDQITPLSSVEGMFRMTLDDSISADVLATVNRFFDPFFPLWEKWHYHPAAYSGSEFHEDYLKLYHKYRIFMIQEITGKVEWSAPSGATGEAWDRWFDIREISPGGLSMVDYHIWVKPCEYVCAFKYSQSARVYLAQLDYAYIGETSESFPRMIPFPVRDYMDDATESYLNPPRSEDPWGNLPRNEHAAPRQLLKEDWGNPYGTSKDTYYGASKEQRVAIFDLTNAKRDQKTPLALRAPYSIVIRPLSFLPTFYRYADPIGIDRGPCRPKPGEQK